MNLEIYTDGSWNTKTKAGGWAYTIESTEGHFIEDGGYSSKTTNNRMELNAIAQALIYTEEVIKAKGYNIENIVINTDSSYCITMINNLLESNETDALHQKVKNSGIINYIVNLIKGLGCTFKIKHVAGHSASKQNDYVDRLAVQKRIEGEKEFAKTRAEHYATKNAVSYY